MFYLSTNHDSQKKKKGSTYSHPQKTSYSPVFLLMFSQIIFNWLTSLIRMSAVVWFGHKWSIANKLPLPPGLANQSTQTLSHFPIGIPNKRLRLANTAGIAIVPIEAESVKKKWHAPLLFVLSPLRMGKKWPSFQTNTMLCFIHCNGCKEHQACSIWITSNQLMQFIGE